MERQTSLSISIWRSSGVSLPCSVISSRMSATLLTDHLPRRGLTYANISGVIRRTVSPMSLTERTLCPADQST